MSTEFINDQWRLPNEENKSKVSNYSMDFDSARVNLGTSLDLGINSTISFWIKKDDTSSSVVISENSYQYGYLMYLGGKIYIYIGSATKSYDYSMVVGQWYHLVIVRQGTSIEVFLNNTSLGTQTGFGTSVNTKIAGFGAKTDGTFAFNGKLDGMSAFNYALSSSQVTTLYGSSSTGIGNPMTLNPVAFYNLGDKSAFNGADYLVPNSSLKDFVFDFGGSEESVDINNDFENYTQISVSTWVNFNNFSGYQYIFSTAAPNNGAGTQFSIAKWDNTGEIYSYDGANFNRTSVSVILNTWNHILVTQTGTTRKVFINGQQAGNDITTSALNLNQGTAFIGKYHTSGYSANAKMSNVQIFNTSLPATGSNSVETLYNNGSPLTSMTGFTSLVSWYKLNASDTYDSSTGTWTIEDHAGSNDGTSSGMTQANLVVSDLSYKSGFSPYALDFDSASSDYIDCGNDSSLNLTSEISLSAWVKTTDQDSTNNIIKKDDGTGNRSWNLSWRGSSGGSRLVFWNWSSDGSYNYLYTSGTPASNFADGNWHHVVATYDGTTDANGAKIYLDGDLMSQGAISRAGTGLDTTTANVTIGNDLTASISNASIWNTALTSAQVKELYSEGIPQNLNNHSAVSSLVSWWQLGSNSSFNSSLNQWTCIDEKGTNTGESSQTFNEDAIVDGVGSYANGLSSGMGGDEVIGDAPYSSSNSLSYNMDVLDRVEDTPS
jgi:hypothetical protein